MVFVIGVLMIVRHFCWRPLEALPWVVDRAEPRITCQSARFNAIGGHKLQREALRMHVAPCIADVSHENGALAGTLFIG
jgi:hypothetical protein